MYDVVKCQRSSPLTSISPNVLLIFLSTVFIDGIIEIIFISMALA
jgi:hypothetical protein